MRQPVTLQDLSERLRVSARQIWELMLVFPSFVSAECGGHGGLLFPEPAQECVAAIVQARRQGWTDSEIERWLERATSGGATSVSQSSVNPGAAPASKKRTGTFSLTASSSTSSSRPVEEELLVWQRLVDLSIQPFLGRIDALAREVRVLKRN